MFKIKVEKKQIIVPRCTENDIIMCNLPEGDRSHFYVEEITSHGVIIGSYVSEYSNGNKVFWIYGENYDIVCSVVPEH